MKVFFLAISLLATITCFAQENSNLDKWTSGRPDGHAPITVMGDHMHSKGEWMFSYRYMDMSMNSLIRDNEDASIDDALQNYMVTPTNMPMNMHMVGTMFAPSDNITLMAMVNYTSMKMDHINGMGNTFTTKANGFGDTSLSILYRFYNKSSQSLHGQLGVSIPTGSVNKKDVTPASAPNETVLPYPMQLGSGTIDPLLAFTYLGQTKTISWGSQIRGVFRLGKNDRDYRYGNSYNWNNWIALKTTEWLSFSFRLEGVITDKIKGVDPNLNPMMVNTADTTNSGNSMINGGLGVNFYIPTGTLKNLRFGLEVGTPFYQNVNGIQLKTKETLVFGTQYSF